MDTLTKAETNTILLGLEELIRNNEFNDVSSHQMEVLVNKIKVIYTTFARVESGVYRTMICPICGNELPPKTWDASSSGAGGRELSESLIAATLIELWVTDETLQVSVPYLRMAAQAAHAIKLLLGDTQPPEK